MHHEEALDGIQAHVVLPNWLQYVLKVCCMTIFFYSIHYHVIYLDFQVMPYLVGKYGVDESLVDDAIILEVEGHDIIIIVSMV